MTTQPTEDFLFQLQERLALNEDAAVSTLAAWLSSYEPGPVARAHQGALRRGARDSGTAPRARRPSTWPR